MVGADSVLARGPQEDAGVSGVFSGEVLHYTWMYLQEVSKWSIYPKLYI